MNIFDVLREKFQYKRLFKSSLIFLTILILWMVLEILFYKQIQPRMVDDIIGLILFYFIYKGVGND